MGIKNLIVITCSPGIMKVNIVLLTKLNLEAADLLLVYYFSLFELVYIFARTISNLLLDNKDSITFNVDLNVHII